MLTLDEAVTLALQKQPACEELGAGGSEIRLPGKYSAQQAASPNFNLPMLGGELLQPFDFTFPEGVLGTYPGIGPIPATKPKSTRPRCSLHTSPAASINRLTQQYKIGLAIRATELGRDIAREDVRAERQKIAAEVRDAYFNLVAVQASVDAAREAVKTLEEAQRVTAQYVAEKTVLRADALDVDARLANVTL